MSDDNKDHESHPNENLVVAEPDPDPADEAAGSRPERPQSRGVTRRALLGGTALGAGLLAYTSDYEDGGMTHSIARAATVPDEPLITLGPEDDPFGYIFPVGDDMVLKHEASGNEFFYNSTDDRWETNQELNVPALVTDQATINDILDATGLTLSGDPDNPTVFLGFAGTDATNRFWGNEETVAGDNSATVICQFSNADTGVGGLAIVTSRNQSGAQGFTDIVDVAVGNNHTVVGQASTTVTRSYSMASGKLQVAIDDTGETYDISVNAIGGAQT